MTPAARYAAAIGILDDILAGRPSEQALTNWARQNRYAGSKDRAAIRDIVFDAERRRLSAAWCGGGLSGRALILGLLQQEGQSLAGVFCGEGYAPPPVTMAEAAAFRDLAEAPIHVASDIPEWQIPLFQSVPDATLSDIAATMKSRAPLFLRVNLKNATREGAAAMLAAEGIDTRPGSRAETALEVLSNPRRVAQAKAYAKGLVELQDASSQAAVAALKPQRFNRILDYCAGGGGKALALADQSAARVFAHDADPKRMKDIAIRAGRAGVHITELSPQALKSQPPFDLVLVDAPCSGSGTWRRTPSAKWKLDRAALDRLLGLQREILRAASRLVTRDGCLAYATCSLFGEENEQQVADFLCQNPDWQAPCQQQFLPGPLGDGFYIATLSRRKP